ncbi:MAG: thiol oxidoreductase [Acidobacteria bacterium]|nr:MAG: thiol oxidoreductase [Acidobacteriota bacterium]
MSERKRDFFRWAHYTVSVLVFSLALGSGMLLAQSDPGVRGGAPGAGGQITGLTVKEGKFSDTGLVAFTEVQSVQGTIAGTEEGLGPRFNLDSCGGCHSQPAIGGTSPFTNPQIAVATKNGATNPAPISFFISSSGPVREARFKYANPPTNPPIRDGGVHDLFTITGRTDAPGCNISQPDFQTANGQNNLIFRIPTPTFGAGLIEAITDSTIIANRDANAVAKAALLISGHENREGNAGTITRFGWKAQNKSLVIFSGEAYNVEQGVTNDLFPQERDETPGCLFNPTPENHVNFEQTNPLKVLADTSNFANFMRFLAPPAPAASSPSIESGRTLFSTTGCALCHTPSLTTGVSSTAALSGKLANLFSDLLVHHMGSGLADDIVQGAAGPDEFRTAPLWGLGQRIFFLHDGRASDLLQAISQHSSSGSEANAVISNFDALLPQQKQDILNFLRSL